MGRHQNTVVLQGKVVEFEKEQIVESFQNRRLRITTNLCEVRAWVMDAVAN